MSEMTVLDYLIVALGSFSLFIVGRLGRHYQWLGMRATWVVAEIGGMGIWMLLCLTLFLNLAVWLIERAS